LWAALFLSFDPVLLDFSEDHNFVPHIAEAWRLSTKAPQSESTTSVAGIEKDIADICCEARLHVRRL
jgi:hypothetical protein